MPDDSTSPCSHADRPTARRRALPVTRVDALQDGLACRSAATTTYTKSTGLHIGEMVPGCKKPDPILVADNVTRAFGGLKAVDVDHLEIPRNAITALIGPNGAGKTTFFNLLTGFDKPDTGTLDVRRHVARRHARVQGRPARAWCAPSS